MAIVKCSACGKEISDKAGRCLHCGAQIKEPTTLSKISERLDPFIPRTPIAAIGTSFLLLFVLWIPYAINSVVNYDGRPPWLKKIQDTSKQTSAEMTPLYCKWQVERNDFSSCKPISQAEMRARWPFTVDQGIVPAQVATN